MSVRILSMYFGHDANITLIEDGHPVAVIEKERVTRVKHDQGHMLPIVEQALAEARWSPESVDVVAINPYVRPTHQGEMMTWSIDGDTYESYSDYLAYGWRGIPECRSSDHMIELFQGRKCRCIAVDHHLAHIAGAYYTGPFDSCAVMSCDGGGDWQQNAIAHCEAGRIQWIEYGAGFDQPGSTLNIGGTWASVGQMFGWQRLEGAGKLMGLAPYGDPDYDPAIERHLRMMMTTYADATFPAHLWRKNNHHLLDPADPFAQSIAASLQRITDEYYLLIAERAKTLTNADALCMTGGVAMNCVANTRVHRSEMYQETWVPAQPHDGGLSLGMALYVWHGLMRKPFIARSWTPYLGHDAGHIDHELIPEIVGLLEEGKTVGVVHGRAESGPRALGHRSILFDPRLPGIKDRINRHVKHREWFRPFAPMILQSSSSPSRYMSYCCECDERQYPGVAHVDGSTRPQTVSPDDLLAHKIVSAWKDKTGCNVLGNTSFNSCEPLVDTVEQARDTWRRTGLDVLVSKDGIETDKRRSYEVQGPSVICVDAIGSFAAPFHKVLRDHGMRVTSYRGLDLGCLQAVQRADVVWCEWADEIAAELSRKLEPGPKLVVRCRAYEAHRPPHPALVERIDWSRVDALVASSEHYAQRLRDMVPRISLMQDIPVVNAGVDVDAIKYVDKREAPEAVRKTVLVFGRLEQKKGSNLLPVLAREFPGHVFLHGGSCTDDKIADLINHWRLENLQTVGEVEHKDRSDFFSRGAYILCVSPRESFGVAIGEGIAAGCVPIVWDYPGAEQTWGPDAIVRGVDDMRSVLAGERETDTAARREWVREQYGIDVMTSRFVAVIEEVLK